MDQFEINMIFLSVLSFFFCYILLCVDMYLSNSGYFKIDVFLLSSIWLKFNNHPYLKGYSNCIVLIVLIKILYEFKSINFIIITLIKRKTTNFFKIKLKNERCIYSWIETKKSKSRTFFLSEKIHMILNVFWL